MSYTNNTLMYLYLSVAGRCILNHAGYSFNTVRHVFQNLADNDTPSRVLRP